MRIRSSYRAALQFRSLARTGVGSAAGTGRWLGAGLSRAGLLAGLMKAFAFAYIDAGCVFYCCIAQTIRHGRGKRRRIDVDSGGGPYPVERP